MKILVVDDEPVIRSLFQDILKDHGHTVEAVCNGQEAVDIIREKKFDMAFMDVHMPVLNGLEALIKMKQVQPDLSIVMMDSFPDQLAQEAEKRGAITCMHKPFHINEVTDLITKEAEKQGGLK